MRARRPLPGFSEHFSIFTTLNMEISVFYLESGSLNFEQILNSHFHWGSYLLEWSQLQFQPQIRCHNLIGSSRGANQAETVSEVCLKKKVCIPTLASVAYISVSCSPPSMLIATPSILSSMLYVRKPRSSRERSIDDGIFTSSVFCAGVRMFFHCPMPVNDKFSQVVGASSVLRAIGSECAERVRNRHCGGCCFGQGTFRVLCRSCLSRKRGAFWDHLCYRCDRRSLSLRLLVSGEPTQPVYIHMTLKFIHAVLE